MTDRWTPPAPIPEPAGPLDSLRSLKMLRSQIEGLPDAVFTQDVWRTPMPSGPVMVMAPDLVEAVLLTQAENFTHGGLVPRIMQAVWGNGMFVAEGEDWRRQRQAAAPAFRAREMETLRPRFVAAAEAMLARWRQGDGAFELGAEMRRLTFEIIVDVLLSGGDGFDSDEMRGAMTALFGDVNRMRPSYFLMTDRWHASRPAVQSQHRARVIERIKAIAKARRDAAPRGDLIDLLLSARDPETGAAFDDDLLADNLLGFVMAGYETTSVALTWTLWLAMRHEATRARLKGELSSLPEGGDFLRQVIRESMRLYPPAFSTTRVCQQATEIGGHKLSAGQRVLVPIYAIHRHARRWEDPHVFDPDRFAPGKPAPHRFAYMPFGGGPRICIGAAFAMTEMIAVLATVLRRVSFEFAGDETVWPQAGLALYPKHGIAAQVQFNP